MFMVFAEREGLAELRVPDKHPRTDDRIPACVAELSSRRHHEAVRVEKIQRSGERACIRIANLVSACGENSSATDVCRRGAQHFCRIWSSGLRADVAAETPIAEKRRGQPLLRKAVALPQRQFVQIVDPRLLADIERRKTVLRAK